MVNRWNMQDNQGGKQWLTGGTLQVIIVVEITREPNQHVTRQNADLQTLVLSVSHCVQK